MTSGSQRASRPPKVTQQIDHRDGTDPKSVRVSHQQGPSSLPQPPARRFQEAAPSPHRQNHRSTMCGGSTPARKPCRAGPRANTLGKCQALKSGTDSSGSQSRPARGLLNVLTDLRGLTRQHVCLNVISTRGFFQTPWECFKSGKFSTLKHICPATSEMGLKAHVNEVHFTEKRTEADWQGHLAMSLPDDGPGKTMVSK